MTALLMMEPRAGELGPRLHDLVGVMEHVRQDIVAAASDG
jgi:hypothetical protein